MKAIKEPTYKRYITGPLQRFDDRNAGFARFHREQMAKMKALKGSQEPSTSSTARLQKGDPEDIGTRKGFEKKDYALSWGGRTVDYLVRANLYSRDSETDEPQLHISDRPSMTRQVKKAALWYGADQVGVCEVNPTWIYSHWGDYNAYYSGGLAEAGDPIDIPSWLKYAVVIIVEMDYEDIKRSPALDASTSLGYAKMSFVAASLATYIRQFGYHALPSGNDFGVNIPLAIDAGLGELGRHGQLITERYGPRVRISKVYTDLPLEKDPPVDLGVQAFCEKCRLCAEHCPSGAIMKGDRTDEPWDESNNINVLKWPIKAMRCMHWWEKNKSHCSNCIRVCPFNKPDSWIHGATRKIIARTSLFDEFLIKLDGILRYGEQVIP
jgi:reductive dehalogenase